MRVLVISAAFPPMRAGEADHAFHLCRHLADRKLDVHVLTTRTNGVASDSDPRVKVYPIMRNWSWSDLPRLGKFLRRCSPDAVVLMYIGFIYNYHPMITFSPTISKTLLPNVPFVPMIANVYGAHSHQTSILARAIRKGIARWAGVDYKFGTLLRDSNRIIVLSDHHRAILAERFAGVSAKSVLIPPPPIMSIYPDNNGAARERGREALGVKSDEFLLIYFGRVYPGKGIETLLKAFQLVARRRSHVRLVMVGGNIDSGFAKRPLYAQEMYQLPNQLGNDARVSWTGEYQWHSDRPSLYLRAADVCVLPFDEGVMLNRSSFAAAAAHGLSIITTQGAMLEQPFVHQENVFLCPPKNPEVMAAAIEALMDNCDLSQRLRLGALRLAEEWFSWPRAIDRTIATFS